MQHVNLYQPQFRTRRVPFGARTLLLALVAVTAALVTASYAMQARQQPLDARVAELSAERAAAEHSLNDAREALQAARARAEDDGRIASLQAELAAKQRVLALLGTGSDREAGGFARYLDGLAENPVERLWLSAIRIDESGRSLRLSGHALDPGRVPALIGALGDVDAYRGHVFRTVELLRSETDPGRIDFVLASRAGDGRDR